MTRLGVEELPHKGAAGGKRGASAELVPKWNWHGLRQHGGTDRKRETEGSVCMCVCSHLAVVLRMVTVLL